MGYFDMPRDLNNCLKLQNNSNGICRVQVVHIYQQVAAYCVQGLTQTKKSQDLILYEILIFLPSVPIFV